jgi:hypothetical protein
MVVLVVVLLLAAVLVVAIELALGVLLVLALVLALILAPMPVLHPRRVRLGRSCKPNHTVKMIWGLAVCLRCNSYVIPVPSNTHHWIKGTY